MKENGGQPEWVRQFGLFGIIVGDLVGLTVGGAALGYWASLRWKVSNGLAALGGLMGFLVAGWHIIQLIQKENKRKQ